MQINVVTWILKMHRNAWKHKSRGNIPYILN